MILMWRKSDTTMLNETEKKVYLHSHPMFCSIHQNVKNHFYPNFALVKVRRGKGQKKGEEDVRFSKNKIFKWLNRIQNLYNNFASMWSSIRITYKTPTKENTKIPTKKENEQNFFKHEIAGPAKQQGE